MKYTFRSETETVYLNADYQLVILSSNGTSLLNGEATLTALVRRISDGSEVEFDGSCFTWKRHEMSEGFNPVVGIELKVTTDDLVVGSATFICDFSKEGLYWKDTAIISLTATNQGANAPYQRTIFIVSQEKPARPEGNASALPEGWSLQPPPRTNNWKIWASVGYVTFGADNTPIYSEWSDPVEWTGESVLPIVQWCWGDSPEYPPHVTKAILVIDGDIVVYSDDTETVAFIDDDDGDNWYDEIPPRENGKPYLWKREYNYQHTSEEDEWFYYPVNGIQGFDGGYQSLGYIIVGTNSVIFAGLDEDKNPTLTLIHIFIEDISYYFKSAQFTLNQKSDMFYLVATLSDTGVGALQAAYIDYVGTGSSARTAWKDHLTDAEISDGFVLAEIRMNGANIHSVTITTPRRFDAQEKIAFMEILNSGNMDDINVAAKALGVERVFQKVAALEAFINSLYVRYVNLYGSICGGSYNSAGQHVGSGKGVYLDAQGNFKAYDAILRDVQIISEDSSGETIFSIGEILPGLTYNNSETATTKSFIDLFDGEYSLASPKTGTLIVSSSEYNFRYPEDYPLSITAKNLTFEEEFSVTFPYSCTFEIYFNASDGTHTCYLDIYKNNTYQERLTIQETEDPITTEYSASSSDVFRFKNPSSSFANGEDIYVRLRVTEFNDICGGNGEPVYEGNNRNLLIYKTDTSGFNWVYSFLPDVEMTSSETTRISYNGNSFDSMIWRLNGAESDLVSDMLSKFVIDQEYQTNTSSYIRSKGVTRNIKKIYLTGSTLQITDTSNGVYEYENDEFAKTIYINTPSISGGTQVKALLPSTYSSDIGTSENRFDNIYCNTLHAENVNISGSVLYVGSIDNNYTPSNNRYTVYSATLILYSNMVAQYSSRGLTRPSVNAGTGIIGYVFNNTEFEFSIYGGAITPSGYLLNPLNYTDASIGASVATIDSTSETVNFSLTVSGLLTSDSFTALRNALGV